MVWPRRHAMRDASPGWRGWWKITAVFEVHLLEEKTMQVVRVTACPDHGSLTEHFSTAMFLKRFNVKKQRVRS